MSITESATDEQLNVAQRRLLVGVCVLIAAITFIPATYNYLLNPMLEDLGATESQSSLLRQLPSIAALLVIFLSSSLGERLGRRRVMLWCSALFTLGCALVTVAPKLPAVTAGLVLASAAASTVTVVGMGLIAAKITNPKARATAFSSFAIVTPLVYMCVPILPD